jgi:DnaJ-domain-containing protein 1
MAADSGASHLKLTEILLELHRTRQCCVVRIERGSAKKQLVLNQGALACAESNLSEEHLVHILIKLDLLSRNDLSRVSALMKTGKSSDEAVVLAAGLDSESLGQGLREQALMILSSLFGWTGVEIRLFSGEELIRRRWSVGMPIPHALVEAARRAVKVHNLPSSLHPLRGLIYADAASGARTSLPLNSAEAYAYSLVKGRIPVSHLLPLVPAGEAKPEEIIQCLLLLGLLRSESAISEQAAASASRQGAQLSEQIDELLQHFEVTNYYGILSVSPQASEEDIKASYHELAKMYHPDLFQSKEYSTDFRGRVEKLFTYITGAYKTLSDPLVRANYDELRLKSESQVEAAIAGRAAVDADQEKMSETLFRTGRAALMNKEFEKAVSTLK